MATNSTERISFASIRKPFEYPDFLDIQLQSFQDFFQLETNPDFNSGVKMIVVKNALFQKAMEKMGKDYDSLYEVLKGSTAIMFCETGNAPAKLIKNFRKTCDRPILKGAFIEECCYTGDNMLDALCNIKSKNDLIADVIALLQSPAKNVISALQSGGHKLCGILETLSEKPE